MDVYPLMTQVKVLFFSKGQVRTDETTALPDLSAIKEESATWIDISGYDHSFLEDAMGKLAIDPLTVEDVEYGKQRIKVEEYQEYTYYVCKAVYAKDERNSGFDIDEISIIIKGNLIVSFHKNKSTIISQSMRSITNRAGSIKKAQVFCPMVLHTIYDFSVDSFFGIASNIESWILSTGGDILDIDRMSAGDLSNLKGLMRQISTARRQIDELRMMLSQHRDVISMLQRGSIKNIPPDLMPQFRDVYDHTFQLIETLDSYMLRTSDLRDLYFTLRAAYTDNILKLLTVIATIFLPLTFLTGFYGMNFTSGFFQPGSNSITGFYVLVSVMVAIFLTMIVLFRKSGWL